jgi:F0F1-type ATP synthase membrane subunit b/b'
MVMKSPAWATARQKMAEEERRLLRDLRGEVANMALHAAEKMLRQGLDQSAQDRLLKAALADLEQTAGSGR